MVSMVSAGSMEHERVENKNHGISNVACNVIREE
jgi:hypothetical protein